MAKLASEFLQQPTLQALQVKIGEEHHAAANEAIQHENWQKATEEITLALERAPDRPDYYLLRSLAKHRLDDNVGALGDIDATLALDPDAFELANTKFKILQWTDKHDEGLAFMHRWTRAHGYE